MQHCKFPPLKDNFEGSDLFIHVACINSVCSSLFSSSLLTVGISLSTCASSSPPNYSINFASNLAFAFSNCDEQRLMVDSTIYFFRTVNVQTYCLIGTNFHGLLGNFAYHLAFKNHLNMVTVWAWLLIA
jgi:hypothetical protein